VWTWLSSSWAQHYHQQPQPRLTVPRKWQQFAHGCRGVRPAHRQIAATAHFLTLVPADIRCSYINSRSLQQHILPGTCQLFRLCRSPSIERILPPTIESILPR
jgi:hypothetical protein